VAFDVPAKFCLSLMNRINGFEKKGWHWQDIVINEE